MKIQKLLSKELNTEYVPVTELVPIDEQGTQVVPQSNVANVPVLDAEVEEDFKDVRETMQRLIKTGCTAVDDMHIIAEGDEQARSFEVLATLIKTVSETSEKLLTIHERKLKLKGVDPESRKIADPGNGAVNIDKAVFVGTTSDLLKQLKSKDE